MEYTTPVQGPNGVMYVARACGRLGEDGLWQGWLEFLPVSGGEPVRSRRETTQPNVDDLRYWATGLSEVYLDGALSRTLAPPLERAPEVEMHPVFEGPAPDIIEGAPVVPHAVLDPFAVYAQGEAVLRQELTALDRSHLANIIRAYALSPDASRTLARMRRATLVELIVSAVRATSDADLARRAGRPPAPSEQSA